MRLFRVLLFSVSACASAAPAPATLSSTSCPPLPGAKPDKPSNGTTLLTEPLLTPTSKMTVAFSAPGLGERIVGEDPRAYRVKLSSSDAEPGALGFDVALDDQRPRRLPLGEPAISLGQLLGEGELAPGPHWLFAAPVLGSGLVPRADNAPLRSATARRFFVGKEAAANSAADAPSGAAWLRKPEGTYNGAMHADRVLFDCYAFSATGMLLDQRCSIALQAPGTSGQLRLDAPFAVKDAASGEYTATATAATARATTVRFTVNRELNGAP